MNKLNETNDSSKKPSGKHQTFLLIDGLINLLLGILLLLFPLGIAEFMGVPRTNSDFYPTILGGVIFGIGIALLVERFKGQQDITGLGLGGAVVINLCGAGVLLLWLLIAPPDIPIRGMVTLWIIGAGIFILGLLELITKSWRHDQTLVP